MELVWSTSRGGNFVRSIFTFVLTVLMTALLWATAVSQPAQAQAGAATWKGESLIYDGKQYFEVAPGDTTKGLDRQADGTYYLSIETTSSSPLVRKAHVIYFAGGTSPPEATSATYTVYDYSADETFSNPQNEKNIDVTEQGEESSYSSCSVDGIGWIICPVTVFLADSMDNIFSFVAQFVEVEPVVVNDPNSPLYAAWNVMRSFANIAFIIAFMIIIYSQLTNIGISNYGIKKLLPRLVIAAILVNTSFYITAIGVDISNIAGYSLQNLLIDIRESSFSITNQTWSQETNEWASITGFILSGGAAAAGYAGIAAASGGSVAAALYLLVPILIGVLLTALFVLLVLAARQAIIVILIVIAPLAFVANLLPNTEKWFEKWKDLFISMLVFFPAFALVFGGSQLAGGIIIQNANNILMMLFGMAVQVAPLILTPLIIKLSGGLLGRIAGLINDPRRGAMDRAKNWSKDRANLHRQKSLADTTRRANPFRRTAQWFDDNQRNMKERTADYEAQSENRYLRTERHARVNEDAHHTATDRKIIEGRLERDLNVKMATDPHHYTQQLEAANMNQSVEATKSFLDNTIRRAQVGETPTIANPSARTRELVAEAQQLAVASAAHKQATANIDNGIQERIANAFNVELLDNDSNAAEYAASQRILEIASGGQGDRGKNRAQATAYATIRKINKEAIDTNITLFREEAIAHEMTLQDYAGNLIALKGSDNVKDREHVSDDRFEAALQAQIADGKTTVLDWTRDNLYIDQKIVDRIADENTGILKAKGGFHGQAKPQLSLQRYLAQFDEAAKGKAPGEKITLGINNREVTSRDQVQDLYFSDQARARTDTLSNTNAQDLGGVKFGTYLAYSGWDKSGNNNFMKMISEMDLNDPEHLATLRRIHSAARVALEDESIYATITDRIEPTRNIDYVLSSLFGKTPIPRHDEEKEGPPGPPTAEPIPEDPASLKARLASLRRDIPKS